MKAEADLNRTLAALAEPNRRRVVELLRERPRPAGDLARAAGLTPSAMSRHLKTLREAGLVEESHPPFDTRLRVYSLREGALGGLKDWIDQTDRLWADQLAAFKQHLESGAG